MEENTKNMLAGLPYRPDTEELRAISTKAHRLSRDYNQTAD
ncbi:maltose acetyltransferase domain-containing protein, partial [uncultured Lactobacillus sp.]